MSSYIRLSEFIHVAPKDKPCILAATSYQEVDYNAVHHFTYITFTYNCEVTLNFSHERIGKFLGWPGACMHCQVHVNLAVVVENS